MNKTITKRLFASLATMGVILAVGGCKKQEDPTKTLQVQDGNQVYVKAGNGNNEITKQELYQELRFNAFNYVNEEIAKQVLDNETITKKKYYSEVISYKNDSDIEAIKKSILSAIYGTNDLDTINDYDITTKVTYEVKYIDNLQANYGITITIKEAQDILNLTTEDMKNAAASSYIRKIMNIYALDRAKFNYALDLVKEYNNEDFINNYYEDDENNAYFKDTSVLISTVFTKIDYESTETSDYSDLKSYYESKKTTFYNDEEELRKLITSEDEIKTNDIYNTYIMSFDTLDEANDAINQALNKNKIESAAEVKTIYENYYQYSANLDDYNKVEYTKTELESINTNVATLVEAFAENLKKPEENKLNYTIEPRNYDGKYYIIMLESKQDATELPTWDEFLKSLRGEVSEESILTQTEAKQVYDYIVPLIYEGKVSETVKSAALSQATKLSIDANSSFIAINERALSIQYSVYNDDYQIPKTLEDTSVFMTINNTKYSLEQVYNSLEEIYGITTAQDLLINKVLLNDSSLDSYITDARMESYVTELEDNIKAFKKDELSSQGYPKSIGLDNYKLLEYHVDGDFSNDAILKNHYEVELRKQYLLESYLLPKSLIDKGHNDIDDYDDVENEEIVNFLVEKDFLTTQNDFKTLTMLANKNHKDYYSATISHILLSIDYDNDGQPDDPNDYIKALKDANQTETLNKFNNRIQSIMNYVYDEIKASKYTKLDTVLNDIVKNYNKNGALISNASKNWGDIKSGADDNTNINFRISIKTESLGEISSSNGSNYVSSFTNAVKRLYKQITSQPGFDFDADNFEDAFLMKDENNVDAVKSTFGYHFLMATDVAEQESLINRVTDDIDYEEYAEDYTGNPDNILYYFDSEYNLVPLKVGTDGDTAINTVIGSSYSFERSFLESLSDDEKAVYGLTGLTTNQALNASYITISQAIIYYYQTSSSEGVYSLSGAVESACSTFLTTYFDTYSSTTFSTYMLAYRYSQPQFTGEKQQNRASLLKQYTENNVENYATYLPKVLEDLGYNDEANELKDSTFEFYQTWWTTFKF